MSRKRGPPASSEISNLLSDLRTDLDMLQSMMPRINSLEKNMWMLRVKCSLEKDKLEAWWAWREEREAGLRHIGAHSRTVWREASYGAGAVFEVADEEIVRRRRPDGGIWWGSVPAHAVAGVHSVCQGGDSRETA